MNPEQIEEQADLVAAVRTLIDEVRKLNDRMKLYAPREEVRKESRGRAWRFMGAAVVCILLAQIMTMTTISYCFLDATGARKPACGLMPGYNEVLRQSDVRLARFERLLTTIEANQNRIENLESRVAQLERGSK